MVGHRSYIVSDKTIECPQCEGTGKWITENSPEGRTCVNCDGKGTIKNPSKAQMMDLKHVAKETLKIIKKGSYRNKNGQKVRIKDDINSARENTFLYSPAALDHIFKAILPFTRSQTEVTVTDESSQQAAYRLSKSGSTIMLNFASAKSAGGGFINGRIAQEEDICRCSSLYDCIAPQKLYYNIKHTNTLYSRHLIYSPAVPFFRTKGTDMPDTFFLCSVITSAAPNAGAYVETPENIGALNATIILKIRDVLTIAKAKGYTNLVLGAWGCGVFKNDPKEIAAAFNYYLNSKEFRNYFEEICFPIYGDKNGKVTSIFKKELL
jgi:uncharacterized protein (TIGR02452 family)